MKKLILFFAMIIFASFTVNAQDNNETKVLEILNNSERLDKDSTKMDLKNLEIISQDISIKTKNSEIAIDAVKKGDYYIILTSNMKDKLTVYLYNKTLDFSEKFIFGADFSSKLKSIVVI